MCLIFHNYKLKEKRKFISDKIQMSWVMIIDECIDCKKQNWRLDDSNLDIESERIENRIYWEKQRLRFYLNIKIKDTITFLN